MTVSGVTVCFMHLQAVAIRSWATEAWQDKPVRSLEETDGLYWSDDAGIAAPVMPGKRFGQKRVARGVALGS